MNYHKNFAHVQSEWRREFQLALNLTIDYHAAFDLGLSIQLFQLTLSDESLKPTSQDHKVVWVIEIAGATDKRKLIPRSHQRLNMFKCCLV